MKPFRVRIIQYADLDKYLPPSLVKGDEYNKEDWDFRDKELYEYEICIKTKDWLLTPMQNKMKYKDKDYIPFSHK